MSHLADFYLACVFICCLALSGYAKIMGAW